MKKLIRHKFNAKPTTFNGRKYASKLEASYAATLELAKKAGDLLFYLEQVPLRLPGGVIYRCDFLEFWSPEMGDQGSVVFTEVKGYPTPQGMMKISMAEEIYGIKINVVKK